MKIFICILLGYLLGSISPSALIAKIKNKNIRNSGSCNLGATNVMLNFGKLYGLLVMVFDILKGFAASKFAELICPEITFIGLIGGLSAIVGHIFPFYLRFKGGKGFASFCGMILAYNPLVFLGTIIVGVGLAFIINYSFAMSYSVSILFCIIGTIISKDIWVFSITFITGLLIMFKHFENLKKALNKTDIPVRASFKKDPLKE